MSRATHLEVESPGGEHTIVVSPDKEQSLLTDLLRREHLPLNTRCGGQGLCDGCLVELVDREGGVTSARGCELRVADCRNRRVRILTRSLLAHEPQVVSEFRISVPYAQDPLSRTGLGAAIDIGTTTVAVLVVDLASGDIVGRAAGFNRQMHFGDDVLTRINLCATDPSMLKKLQTAVVSETVAPLLQTAGVSFRQLECVTVAGNTTMLHLFAGVDPTPMGTVPFTPAFLDHRTIRLAGLGDADVHLLPGAAAYVGADLVAGSLASGLAYEAGPSLLVDVGTNGEIILKLGEHIFGCATAAGPAFEGAGLSCGMRAAAGAIERIQIMREPFGLKFEVIGRGKPTGVCGSAYVDLLAEGRRTGALDERGRFNKTIITGSRWQLANDVFVTESDIARLLQAKAAIAAGILTLLHRVGLTPAQVHRLNLAGGFGMHLDVRNAIDCGLLPDFTPEQVQVVGNTSLAGAYLALVDSSVLAEFKRLAQRIEVIELNLQPDFESCYIDQLSIPESKETSAS